MSEVHTMFLTHVVGFKCSVCRQMRHLESGCHGQPIGNARQQCSHVQGRTAQVHETVFRCGHCNNFMIAVCFLKQHFFSLFEFIASELGIVIVVDNRGRGGN